MSASSLPRATVSPPHPLLESLRHVKAGIERQLRIAVAAKLTAAFIAWTFFAAAVDFIGRGQAWFSPLVSLAWYLGILGGVVYGWRNRPLSLDIVSLARQLEGHFPTLRHQLSSAAEFLLQPRADSGSASLKQLMISRTWQAVQQEDLATVVNRRFANGNVSTALVAGTFVLIASVFYPQYAQVAASHLLLPFAQEPQAWPRRNQLRFENPPLWIEQGSPVDFVVTDARGLPPQDAFLEIIPTNGKRERHALQLVDQRLLFHMLALTEPVQYRAVGGDDDAMPWRELRIVAPIGVSDFEIQCLPPPYCSGKPTRVHPPLSLIAGSQLRILGRTNRAITAVRIVGPNAQPFVAGEIGEQNSFQVPGEGSTWQPTISGLWRLEFTDASQAIVLERALDIQVVPDQPPTVRLLQPSGELRITPEAIIRLQGTAEDDCGLKSLRLQWQVVGVEQPAVARELWTATGKAPLPLAVDISEALDVSREAFTEPTVRMVVWAEDGLGQVSAKVERRFTIVSADTLRRELNARLPEFVAVLEESLAEVKEVEKKWRSLAPQAPPEKRMMEEALFRLERVRRQLLQPSVGLHERLETWLQTWRDNRLVEDANLRGWNRVVRELRTEGSPRLRDLLDSLRGETSGSGPSFAAIVLQQRDLVSLLERWLREVATQQQATRLAAELWELKAAQAQLLEQTKEVQIEWLTAADKETRAERKTLADQQWEIARRWDRWLNRVVANATSAAANDPWQGVAAAGRQAGLATIFREAAKAIAAARGPQAVGGQEDALRILDELLARLPTNEQRDVGKLTAAWKQLRAEIAALVAAQQQLDEAWQRDLEKNGAERGTIAAKFAVQQRALTQNTRQFAGKITTSDLRRVSELLSAAAAAQDASAAAAERHAWRDSLAQSLAAVEELRSAEQALQRAIQSAQQAEQRQKAEAVVAHLRLLIPRQEAVLGETQRLHGEYEKIKEWTRAMRASCEKVAHEQASLAEEIGTLSSPNERDAAGLILAEIKRLLSRAAAAMERLEFGGAVQQDQAQGLAELRALHQILTEEARANPDPDAELESSPANTNTKSGSTVSLADLQLVLRIQRDIGRRVAGLPQMDKTVRSQEISTLQRQQGELAELVAGWSDAANARPKFDPPQTAEAWQTLVAQELSSGEDLGENKRPVTERLAFRMRLAEGMLAQDHLAEFPKLQAALEQELQQLAASVRQQRSASQQLKSNPKSGRPASSGGEPTGTSGSESTQQPQKPTQVELNPAELRELARKVWGHLPPKLREELLQAGGEEFLPEYAAEIREYYRRLAKERAGTP